MQFSDGSPVEFPVADSAAFPLRWYGTGPDGVAKHYGYAMTSGEAADNAIKAGAVNCHVQDNPDFARPGAVEPEAGGIPDPAVVSESAAQVETLLTEVHTLQAALTDSEQNKANLATANATMFKQVSALKDALRDIESAALAWASEEHVKAIQPGAAPYAEPLFLTVLRDRMRLA